MVAGALALGSFFMVVALVVQSIAQSIPALLLLEVYHSGASALEAKLLNLELAYPVEYSVFIGLTAAAAQEGTKYVAVDMRSKELTVAIGLGFSLIDIAVLMLRGYTLFGTAHLFALLLLALNVISSLLFHPGTAAFMKWGRQIGIGASSLMGSIALHTILDGGVAYANLYVLVHPAEYVLTSALFWAVAMTISIGIFILGTRKLKGIEEVPEKIGSALD